jgi:hypothetical protein
MMIRNAEMMVNVRAAMEVTQGEIPAKRPVEMFSSAAISMKSALRGYAAQEGSRCEGKFLNDHIPGTHRCDFQLIFDDAGSLLFLGSPWQTRPHLGANRLYEFKGILSIDRW